jgi:hypothetical protein
VTNISGSALLKFALKIIKSGYKSIVIKNFTIYHQPTPDNRRLTSRNKQQQPPTGTPDNRQPAFDNRHLTTSNKQLRPTATPDCLNQHPTTESQQSTAAKKTLDQSTKNFYPALPYPPP